MNGFPGREHGNDPWLRRSARRDACNGGHRAAGEAATFVYVGCTDSNEIHVLQLNPQNGDLTPVEKVTIPGITKTAGSTPMAISPDKKFLFAATRGEPMVAASFRIDPATGKLSHIANGPLDGSMAYIATDRSGRFLLAASYPNNKVTVNPIAPDGTVQPPKQIVPTEPNAHAIQPDASNRFVLATSLGGNLVQAVPLRCRDRNALAQRSAGGAGESGRRSTALRVPSDQWTGLPAERARSVGLCLRLRRQDRHAEGTAGGRRAAREEAGKDLGGRPSPDAGRQVPLCQRARHQHDRGLQGRSRRGHADADRTHRDRAAAARLRHRSHRPLSPGGGPALRFDDQLRHRSGQRQTQPSSSNIRWAKIPTGWRSSICLEKARLRQEVPHGPHARHRTDRRHLRRRRPRHQGRGSRRARRSARSTTPG